ncbi:MAG: DNA polymerase I, partial [Anaerolineaceae bacterium]
ADDFDHERVLELFQELEFRTFAERLLQAETPQQMQMFGDDEAAFKPADSLFETVIVNTPDKLAELVDVLSAADEIVWDVETTGVDQMAADLVGIALAVNDHSGYYVPVGHSKGAQLPLARVIDALRPALTAAHIPKYAHNAAFDRVVMARYGVTVTPIAFDTMIAEWLLRPTSKFLSLKAFAAQYFKIHMTPISDLIGKGKDQTSMSDVRIELAAPYAVADAVVTFKAVAMLRDELHDEGLFDLFQTLEMPLVPVIAAMEQAGVALEVSYLHRMSEQLGAQIDHIDREIKSLSGGYGDFNVRSAKQLNDVLFGKLGLPTTRLKKTTHGYSTDASSLEMLRGEHPIIDAIVEYRELSKLKGTYVDALPQLVNPHTGRIHTSYNQTGTSTGRLSSNNPNLQNIPIRTAIGREVRRAFVADEGHVLLAVDYSQIELRVLAHISEDATLIDAFAQDQDIHRATAAAVNRIPLEAVTYEQRSFAKRVNFGLIYGMGAFRLARDSELSQNEAQRFIDAYFKRLPGVRDYIENTRKQARERGVVQTLFGRRRKFPALLSAKASRNIIESEERAAINMPIQGTAADIMKRAMIDMSAALEASQLRARMILQVHDEIVLEVPEDELAAARELVVTTMESAYPLKVPLKANVEIGPNWRDMSEAD